MVRPPATRKRGEFEAAIMSVLRASSSAMTAREIADVLPGDSPALPPLFASLNRLQRKGELLRSNSSDVPADSTSTGVRAGTRGVRFRAVWGQAEHASRTMLEALGASQDRGAALLQFADDLSGEDLDILTRAIQRPRNSGPDADS